MILWSKNVLVNHHDVQLLPSDFSSYAKIFGKSTCEYEESLYIRVGTGKIRT